VVIVHELYIIIIIITDLYSAFRSEDTEALEKDTRKIQECFEFLESLCLTVTLVVGLSVHLHC